MRQQLFVNGKIFTGRSETDFSNAFLVTDGEIEWVGNEADFLVSPSVVIHDLGGRTVLPGLLDMHVHPASMASTADAVECLPPRVGSISHLLEALTSHHLFGQGSDQWIIGAGYDETKYPENRSPVGADLDQVSNTQPIIVWRVDRHTALCNTVALEIAGITAKTPDPEGGRFGRDQDGTPNGILEEFAAISAVTNHIPVRTSVEQAQLMEKVGRRLLSRGIVGVCDLLATTVPNPLAAYRTVAERGPFPRSALFYGWKRPHALTDLDDAEKTGRAKVAGVKVLMDGAYSNRTAWVCQPYPDSSDIGIHTISDEEVRAAAQWARRNEVQMAVHAMGDQAIAHILELFEDEEPWLRDVPSIRIEHATLMSPGTVERIRTAPMNFGIATHTIFLYSEYEAYNQNLHPRQMNEAYPIRSLYHAIDSLALTSDCPATAWSEADNVFVSIEAAVRRRAYTGADMGQASAVTVPQAVLLYTARAANLTSMEGLGQIARGFEGSFVVLSRDIFTMPTEEISTTLIEETWIGGERVYQA